MRFPVTLVLLLAAACGRPDGGPAFENMADDVRFVGEAACTPCHADIASTHQHTGMGRAFFPLSRETAIEDFTDHNVVVVPGTPIRYRMVERDGSYFQQQYVLDSGGNELAMDERRMRFVLGSGNHSRSYVTLLDDRMFQMPVCWYPFEEKWEVCPGYEQRNMNFSREITDSCSFCHNGWMVLKPDSTNAYREPVPHGIGCERCHGPGELHVARWEGRELEASGELDTTIVNPRRLDRETRFQLCFQCHLADSENTEVVLHFGKRFRDWRPGMRFSDVAVPLWFEEISTAKFGISAQADRLMRSRCWRESDGRIECLTCHNPHVTVYQEDRPEDLFRRRCVGCHEFDDCGAPAGEREATPGLRDDCVACHMRRGEPDDHGFTEVTDHWIRVLADEERYEPPSPRMVPVIEEDFAKLSAAEQAYFRGKATLMKSTRLPGELARGMRELALADLREALDAGLEQAEAWYDLGKAHVQLNDWTSAEEAFARAAELDDDHAKARFDLGLARLSLGRLADAIRTFQELLRDDPDHPGALAELGRAYLTSGRPAEALPLYERALRVEPWRSALHVNRAAAYAQLNRLPEALDALDAALRYDPDDPGIWRFYAQALLRSGDRLASAEADRIGRQLEQTREALAREGASGMGMFGIER